MPNNFFRIRERENNPIQEEPAANSGTRVACLYRVSTSKQVEKKNDHQNDEAHIPLQEISCRKFAADNGWQIVKEYEERGVSGYKTPAAKRDVLQEIKSDAERKKFDILLVFMFDRLGRREDETPFVLQWFVEHGIRVWSVQEGEQRIDEHVDKLTNYIRFWQASGESGKTSVRVKQRREQLVASGAWGGGPAPYGYKLVHNGRINKYRKLLYDLEIDEEQAAIVKDIFEKTIVNRWGRVTICNYLNTICPSPLGAVWKPATIAGIHSNSIYTGRMKSGEIFSEPIEALRIISDDDFRLCSKILDSRNLMKNEEARRKAGDLSIGKSEKYGAKLLNGLVVCGSCGSTLYATYQKNSYSQKPYYRAIYRCRGKVVQSNKCKGQTCYSAQEVESAVLSEVDDFMKSLGDHKIKRKNADDSTKSDIEKAKRKLSDLMAKKHRVENEVLLSLEGKSTFDGKNLNSILSSVIKSIDEETLKIDRLTDELISRDRQANALKDARLDAINLYSEFHQCDDRQKNKILHQIIEKIYVYRENPSQPLQITIHFALTEQELHPRRTI